MSDEIGFNVFVDFEKAFDVNNQIFQNRKGRKRRNGNLFAQVPYQKLASECIVPIDLHRVGAADPVGAGPAVRQGTVDIPLDIVEGVQQAVNRLCRDCVLAPTGFVVLIRIEAPDFQPYFQAYSPLQEATRFHLEFGAIFTPKPSLRFSMSFDGSL